ncbi:hypothetical protein VNI00_010409 [Paramarasmius palmivorus]|uniref:F-box domain-containing protein n=1 Tax=Paramarasmius palmivorus TaxID=297713 RepID=A0AAW0CJI1_9AGAR
MDVDVLNLDNTVDIVSQPHYDSPINRLPPELLSIVFDYTVTSNTFSHSESTSEASQLAKVCRRWRTISHFTREIWSRLTLDFEYPSCLGCHIPPDSTRGSFSFFSEGVFRSFQAHIRLSADAPLAISLIGLSYHTPCAETFLSDIAREHPRTVRNHPLQQILSNAGRIQELHIDCSPDHAEVMHFMRHIQHKLVKLETLKLDSRQASINHFLNEMPDIFPDDQRYNLRNVDMTFVTGPHEYPSLFSSHFVTHLDLETTPSTTLWALKSFPSLDTVHFSIITRAEEVHCLREESPWLSILHPNLRTLSFGFSDDGFWKGISLIQNTLKLPCLTHLAYTNRSMIASTFMPEGAELVQSTVDLLIRSTCESLSLSEEPSPTQRMHILSQAALRSLRISGIALGGDNLLALLESMPSLTDLSLREPYRRIIVREETPPLFTAEIFGKLRSLSFLPILRSLRLCITPDIQSIVKEFAQVLEERGTLLSSACLEIHTIFRLQGINLPTERLRKLQEKVAFRVIQVGPGYAQKILLGYVPSMRTGGMKPEAYS